MRNRPTIFISLSVVISLLVVLVLYLGSAKKPNYQYASFQRNLVNESIEFVDTFNMKRFNYYLAGNTSNTIYLGNLEMPRLLVSLNTAFTDTAHFIVRVDNDTLKYNSLKVSIDSPYFYLADGTRPFIYRGDLENRVASKYADDIYFKAAIPISKNSVATVALVNKENTIGRKRNGIPGADYFPNLLEEQGEGIFSTDGVLHYDRQYRRLLYTYFYRNQYLVMDTSLNLIYSGNTIDTIAHAKIEVGQYNSGNTYTMSAPPLKVNNKCAISGNYIYINSNLLGMTEDKKEFEKNSVIDVYNLETHRYEYSFYLPDFDHRKLNHFIVIDNKTLIAQHEPFLVKYKINRSGEMTMRKTATP